MVSVGVVGFPSRSDRDMVDVFVYDFIICRHDLKLSVGESVLSD
jgi:hypothetical protein